MYNLNAKKPLGGGTEALQDYWMSFGIQIYYETKTDYRCLFQYHFVTRCARSPTDKRGAGLMVYIPEKIALTVDQEQAKQQLELLGYQPGDNIYLTAFFPKGDLRTKGENRDKGRKSDRLNHTEVEKWQAEGRGVYFVVNGHGHGKIKSKTAVQCFTSMTIWTKRFS
jgi:hypothetical protein